MKKLNITILTLTAIVAMSFFARSQKYDSFFNIEEMPYQVLESDGDFEIREYPAVFFATVTRSGNYEGQNNGSFMTLFNYISEGNATGQKINMTKPVVMEETPAGETRMSFMVPTEIPADEIPSPTNPNVEIRQSEPGRYAVIRFGGYISQADIDKYSSQLKKKLEERGLPYADKVQVWGYDAPFKPIFRRNEVAVRLLER